MKTKLQHSQLVSILVLLMTSVVSLHAQNVSADAKLLDEFIASKGYRNSIVFDASNIKQFWIDTSIIGKDGNIVVLPSVGKEAKHKYESSFYKVQLANVNPMLDCRIDVITKDSDLGFSIADNKSKTLSTSTSSEDFIQYHVLSSSFHLLDTADYSFNINFFSNTSNTISIKKIILSFLNNSSDFLTSPGILHLGEENVTITTKRQEASDKSQIVMKGWSNIAKSTKRIVVSDNILTVSGTVKNIGDTPTRIYVAYAPYTKDGKQIIAPATLYKNNNQVLKVLSHEKGSNKVMVDSYPVQWQKGCSLALNAKEDLSDFPNCFLADGRIQEINRINGDQAEIVFNKPSIIAIEPGTLVRIQSVDQGTFMYPETKVLEPGEEFKFSFTTKKDDKLQEYSTKTFCKGTHFVVPVIVSNSVNSKVDNTVLISDYTVSY